MTRSLCIALGLKALRVKVNSKYKAQLLFKVVILSDEQELYVAHCSVE